MTPTDQLLQRLDRKIDRLQHQLNKLNDIVCTDVRTTDRLISVREACAMLGKKKSAVYAMIHSGQLPARSENGRKYQLSLNQVQKYISQ